MDALHDCAALPEAEMTERNDRAITLRPEAGLWDR